MRTNSPIDESITSLNQVAEEKPKVSPRDKEVNKFKKSKKYPHLVAHIDQKVEFYKRYLPGGIKVSDLPAEEVKAYWHACSMLIAEFQELIDLIESVSESVDNEPS